MKDYTEDKFISDLISGKGERYERLKAYVRDEIIKPYLKAQSGVEYIEVSDIIKILPDDPLEMAKIFVEENEKHIKDKDPEESKNLEFVLGLLNLHYKKMITSMVSEINGDMTRDTNYNDCKFLIEGAGYERVYANTVLEEEECMVSDLDFLESRGVDMINIQRDGDDIKYQVEYDNELYYNKHNGTIMKVAGRKDGYYSPSVTFYGETKKYPNDNNGLILASSDSVDYADAFSMSLGKELMLSRIQKILESGNSFNKDWHSFDSSIFKFERGNDSFVDVLTKIKENHPEVIESVLASNVKGFFDYDQKRNVGNFHMRRYNPNELGLVECRISKISEYAKSLRDEDLEDLVLRDNFFDARYVIEDKVGWYSKDFLKNAEKEGLTQEDVERYYPVFMKEAANRGIEMPTDRFAEFLDSLSVKEQDKVLRMNEKKHFASSHRKMVDPYIADLRIKRDRSKGIKIH